MTRAGFDRTLAGAGGTMTYFTMPEEFSADCARAHLSDAAFRTHVEALLWCLHRRCTGGELLTDETRRWCDASNPDAAIGELIRRGFWEETDDGWLIVRHVNFLPDWQRIEAQRKANRERQTRHRLRVVEPDA